MKLFIINGDNNRTKIEIHIDESLKVRDIKYKIDEILHGNGYFRKDYFRLIHKNMILESSYLLARYKICENDKIWFGKIENYLRKDYVIVYALIWGIDRGDEYLIMKINDTISTIRSIIEINYSEIINIWGRNGKQMKNDQIITEIDESEDYKLLIKCDDGKGNWNNNTFDECCYLYEKSWAEMYFSYDRIRDDDNINESKRNSFITLINRVKQAIPFGGIIDGRLKQNLSDLPSSYLNCSDFFCVNMADCIMYICNNFWRPMKNQFDNYVVKIFDQYFPLALRAALWEFSDQRQKNKNSTSKSISEIIVDALDYAVKYLNDSSNDWRYLLRLWLDKFSWRSLNEFDTNKMIDEYASNKFPIKIRTKGEDINSFIKFKPDTITKAKQSVANAFNVDKEQLYIIKPGGDHKPNDEDKFEEEHIIEKLSSMDEIEILRLLGRGSFGEIYLCRDKISNKHLVIKKPISIHGDLCRDINIYSKLNLSANIMNYSGLFRDGESICIGMEYMSGGSLNSYLDKGKQFLEQEIVKISYEIFTQINELHKLGIIHRDIKSDNIVLNEYNKAKLIDFGLSKYIIGLTSKCLSDKLNEYKPGTICYMAPELIKGEPYSEKIDIWSFGMVMVEMVTGKRPFHWLTHPQTVLKIRGFKKYEFEPICTISNELNQFINSCFNTNPDERPSAEQLINSEFIIDYVNEK